MLTKNSKNMKIAKSPELQLKALRRACRKIMTPQCPSTHTRLCVHTYVCLDVLSMLTIATMDSFISFVHRTVNILSCPIFIAFIMVVGVCIGVYVGKGFSKQCCLSYAPWMCAFVRFYYPRPPFPCVWLFIPFTGALVSAWKHTYIHTYV